ncbi:hypothetical protein D3C75_721380 [compost metagenome]
MTTVSRGDIILIRKMHADTYSACLLASIEMSTARDIPRTHLSRNTLFETTDGLHSSVCFEQSLVGQMQREHSTSPHLNTWLLIFLLVWQLPEMSLKRSSIRRMRIDTSKLPATCLLISIVARMTDNVQLRLWIASDNVHLSHAPQGQSVLEAPHR